MRAKAPILALAALTLGGCTTANYSHSKIHSANGAGMEHLNAQARVEKVYIPEPNSNVLPYDQAAPLAKMYESAPKADFTLTINGGLEGRVNTGGIMNPSLGPLSRLEAIVPSTFAERAQGRIGPADTYFVSSRSGDNQLTNASQMNGFTYLADGDSGVTILVKESENPNKRGNDEKVYRISVTFGTKEDGQKKVRDGMSDPLRIVEDIIPPGVLFGPYAAGGAAGVGALERVWAYFEGGNVPDGTSITRTQPGRFVGMSSSTVAEVYNILDMAQDTRANDVHVVTHNGTGIVYASNTRDLNVEEGTVSFTTSEEGANHWLAWLHRSIGLAADAGAYASNNNTRTRTKTVPGPGPNPPGVGGGRTGSPGGTNPTSGTGRSTGSPGGN